MSLRVLLADESTTIKKVFELGLQDYGIEVKNVTNGLDVVAVCQSFLPDIIFVDILLQKKNGYLVCAELKKTPKLSTIPVIMMWSSFMELDQNKYLESGADEKLEKPFDVDHLRTMIKKHVNKTEDQRLSSLLSFSPSITKDFLGEESNKLKSPDLWKKRAEEELSFESNFNSSELEALNEVNDDIDAMTAAEDYESWKDPSEDILEESNSHEDLELPSLDLNESSSEDFPPISSIKFAKPKMDTESNNDLEGWKEQTLSKFKVELPPDDEEDHFASVRLENSNPETPANNKKINPTQKHVPEANPNSTSFKQPLPSRNFNNEKPKNESMFKPQGLDLKSPELEAMIKSHIESVVKLSIHKLLPDLVEKVVKEELNKLLDDEIQNEMDAP